MDSSGFDFRYRLRSGEPSVRRLRFKKTQRLSRGDFVNYEGGEIDLAETGDEDLLGIAMESKDGEAARTYLNVIVNGDAVYAAPDAAARLDREPLDLTGTTGAQGLAESVNREFTVVGDCPADAETRVRITPGKHRELASPPRTPRISMPGRSLKGTRPELSPEEERDLVRAAAAGDATARAQLVEAFLPAIAGVARLYRASTAVDRAELLQEGVVGLLRAAQRFDPSLGTPFWAYASWWVRQAMQQLVAEVTRPAVLSDRALRGLARVKGARREYTQAHGREPTGDELVAETGLTRDQVDSLLSIERAPRGLDELLGGEDATTTLGEMLVDPVAEGEYEKVIEQVEIEQVRDLSEHLGTRERSVLEHHYGLGGQAVKTLREIGDELGLSAERVRQIEQQALDKLRAAAV
jgi:RNA polymerase sigma factor (sigma-70 family)